MKQKHQESGIKIVIDYNTFVNRAKVLFLVLKRGEKYIRLKYYTYDLVVRPGKKRSASTNPGARDNWL